MEPLLSSNRWCLDAAAEALGPDRCRAQDGVGGVVPVLSSVLAAATKVVGVSRGTGRNPAPSMMVPAMM
jgi:hypothetical protein